jgi:hypothetical protein
MYLITDDILSRTDLWWFPFDPSFDNWDLAFPGFILLIICGIVYWLFIRPVIFGTEREEGRRQYVLYGSSGSKERRALRRKVQSIVGKYIYSKIDNSKLPSTADGLFRHDDRFVFELLGDREVSDAFLSEMLDAVEQELQMGPIPKKLPNQDSKNYSVNKVVEAIVECVEKNKAQDP